MKKFMIALILLTLSFSFALADDYTPALGMDMNTFLSKYNAIGSSLDSSLLSLKEPFNWTVYEGQNVAWFKADSKSSVNILLLSADPSNARALQSGLDTIYIYMDFDSDFLSLITIANRCVQLFSPDVWNTNFAPYYTSDLISYYYQNVPNMDTSVWREIDADEHFMLTFFKENNQFFFTITRGNQ